MNLVLFESHELAGPLPAGDRRALHIVNVLRRKHGDTFDAGVVNGSRGKATLTGLNADGIAFSFTPTVEPTPRTPITLIVGLPRPQTARDILRDATSLGVGAIHFIRSDKAESSYAQSTLWSSGEWRRHVLLGAEQAFDTQIPEVTHGLSLSAVLEREQRDAPGALGIALDNYEAAVPLSQLRVDPGSQRRRAESPPYPLPNELRVGPESQVVLAIGSERGWSVAERDLLRANGFRLAHLGPRVLRTETAVIAALTLARAMLGLV